MVHEEHTIEMIHLVLDNSGKHFFAANLMGVAALIIIFDHHALGSDYILVQTGKRKTSLFESHFRSKKLNDFRIDQSRTAFDCGRFRIADHHHSKINTNLWSSQTYSTVGVQDEPEEVDQFAGFLGCRIRGAATFPEAPITKTPNDLTRTDLFSICLSNG